MLQKKEDLKKWINEHKKQVIIAGVGAGVLITVLACYKNKEQLGVVGQELKDLFITKDKKEILCATDACVCENEVFNEIVTDKMNVIEYHPKKPHDVVSHLRNLPQGWTASLEKKETAAQYGFSLGENQTWVDSYRTGNNAA